MHTTQNFNLAFSLKDNVYINGIQILCPSDSVPKLKVLFVNVADIKIMIVLKLLIAHSKYSV